MGESVTCDVCGQTMRPGREFVLHKNSGSCKTLAGTGAIFNLWYSKKFPLVMDDEL